MYYLSALSNNIQRIHVGKHINISSHGSGNKDGFSTQEMETTQEQLNAPLDLVEDRSN